MTNIWSFLVQTAAVTLTAYFLWGIDRLVSRQLPPRWQYGFWGILALRILLPAASGRYFFLPAGLWIESLKAMVERGLTSAYTTPYTAERLHHVLPWFEKSPVSITDWIFVLYAVGMILFLLRGMISYGTLRRTIEQGSRPAGEEMTLRIEAIGKQYALPVCPACTMAGITSPFVCGIRKPQLILPEDRPVDDKVLLHELLHLKHRDALHNLIWYVLRALHWCNPMLYPIFAQIRNDLEMACDSRVLALLEGEERREYGRILLSMANEKYASMPGTSSIANGGRNIGQRIGAIVYFKKFPKGMAVLGMCLFLLMGAPALYGTAYTVDTQALEPKSALEMERALALVRLRRCTTPAGAIDTYAKGLMLHNGLYRMMAAPAEEMDGLLQQTAYVTGQPNRHPYWLESGGPFGEYPNMQNYQICNFAEQPDGSYAALLLFECQRIGQNSTYQYHTILLPIRVRESDGWGVEPVAEPTMKENLGYFPEERLHEWGVEPMAVYRGTGETGSVETRIYTIHAMEQPEQTGLSFLEGMVFDTAPNPDGGFDRAERYFLTTYTTEAKRDVDFKRTVGLQVAERMEADDAPYVFTASLSSETSGASSDGVSWYNKMIRDNWDGTVYTGSSRRWYADDKEDFVLPHHYEACIYWDGHPVDTIVLTEVK